MSQEERVSISFWFYANCRGSVCFFVSLFLPLGRDSLGRVPSWAPVCSRGQVLLVFWDLQTFLFDIVAFYVVFFLGAQCLVFWGGLCGCFSLQFIYLLRNLKLLTSVPLA